MKFIQFTGCGKKFIFIRSGLSFRIFIIADKPFPTRRTQIFSIFIPRGKKIFIRKNIVGCNSAGEKIMPGMAAVRPPFFHHISKKFFSSHFFSGKIISRTGSIHTAPPKLKPFHAEKSGFLEIYFHFFITFITLFRTFMPCSTALKITVCMFYPTCMICDGIFRVIIIAENLGSAMPTACMSGKNKIIFLNRIFFDTMFTGNAEGKSIFSVIRSCTERSNNNFWVMHSQIKPFFFIKNIQKWHPRMIRINN